MKGEKKKKEKEKDENERGERREKRKKRRRERRKREKYKATHFPILLPEVQLSSQKHLPRWPTSGKSCFQR